MTQAQRAFWEGVRNFARVTRRSRSVELDVAADALALEQEIEERLRGEEPLAAVAESAAGTGSRENSASGA
jgi:hypothetical protein